MTAVAIIGGGAAGFFAAITCREAAPGHTVVIYEGTGEVLSKVRISGGGRCNVTHQCEDPRRLVQQYPRGSRELLGPFVRFGPPELVQWFQERGVALKVEADGRMFPVSNSSETIISCLRSAAEAAGVAVRTHAGVVGLSRRHADWRIETASGPAEADLVLLATGSARSGHTFAAAAGHTIIPPVPSLFTFTCTEPWIRALSGVSVPEVHLELVGVGEDVRTQGPILCTHWGLSGPAVLRASAWGARALHRCGYRCQVRIDWLAGTPAVPWLEGQRRDQGARPIRSTPPPGIPRRLWDALAGSVGISPERSWAQLGNAQRDLLASCLTACEVGLVGKGVFKEEFVTAGGVAREEINWRTMESRRSPGLFFAGECIDVDAITGGFNFQNAWTTGWLAGLAMAERMAERMAD